jgi:hypothetical protein
VSLRWLELDGPPQVRIAAINCRFPKIAIALFRLYAKTWRLISVLTFFKVLIWKCVEPVQAFKVPKGCSDVCRRTATLLQLDLDLTPFHGRFWT